MRKIQETDETLRRLDLRFFQALPLWRKRILLLHIIGGIEAYQRHWDLEGPHA